MLTRSRAHMYVEAEELDQDRCLLNCPNGTLDLRTGELGPHDPEDLITKITAVDYDPAAKCEEWDRVVLDICSNDAYLVRYIQRVLGYSITGMIVEQAMFVFIGGGSNGKDTILGRVLKAFGDYCGLAAPDLLIAPRGGRHPTEIADLRGQRLVIASESSEGARLYESQVKQFTGSDVLKGRRMNGDFFEFPNTSTVVLMTNHRPIVDGTDYGIWRRLHVIPFNRKYLSEEEAAAGEKGTIKDKNLWDRLDARSLPAVLTWCVEGCLDWQENGLRTPELVRNATDEYREEQDVLGDFFAAQCEFKRTNQVVAGAFYKRYKGWCEGQGESPKSQTWLWPKIQERGVRKKRGSGGFIYYGIGLVQSAEESYQGQ
jgi:putative DNA primase/helicase